MPTTAILPGIGVAHTPAEGEDEYGEVDESLLGAICDNASAARHASKAKRGWEILGTPICLLCGMVWQLIRRLRVHHFSTANFSAAEDPVLCLQTDPEAVKYVTGWMVFKLNKCKPVTSSPALVAALQCLTGPKLANTLNFAFMESELKRTSLNSGVPAFVKYVIGLAQTCTTHMTRGDLFGNRQNAYTILMERLEASAWLWDYWLEMLKLAGVHVTVEPSSTWIADPGALSQSTATTLTQEQARLLMGLVVERYTHQRQSAEMKRQKTTADTEAQVCLTPYMLCIYFPKP